MVGKEEVLFESPTLIFNLEDLDHGENFKETFQSSTRYGFIDYEPILAEINAEINAGLGALFDEQSALPGQWGKDENEKLPIIYRIFIDRIEFDLKALEAYINMVSDKEPKTAIAEALAENDEIPEIIFYDNIKDIKFLKQKIQRGWFSATVTGSNCYEITFKDDKKIKIPLEIGDRGILSGLLAYPKLPKLHLWWKELAIGKLPKDLELYLKHKESSKIYGKSELKNTCTRCGKIWYLGADELQDLEGRLTKSATFGKQMTGLNMISAMFNPMLAAQGTTSLAAMSGAMKSQVDELNEKSRCPECQSKNIDRVLVDGNEKIEKVVEGAPQETNKKEGSSLADELKKLSELKEQGILDEEEFKTAKRKLMES